MQTLIGPDDYAVLWALITLGTALAIWLEQTYRWAARLSGPVIALLLAMILSNTRIVPASSPAYDFVGDWLVPLAIPLLLFRANLREIIVTGGRVVLIFHIAAAGTLLGVALAAWLLHGRIPPADLQHASGIMAASYIGGGVNFMAVKASYDVSEQITNPLLVADNFVMAGLFLLLGSIAASQWFRARFPHPHSAAADASGSANLAAQHWQRKGIALLDVARAFAFSFAVLAVAHLAGRFLNGLFASPGEKGAIYQMVQTLCTNRFVLITTTTLLAATLFAQPLAKVNGAEEFGGYLLAIFLFTLGLPADLVTVLTKAPLYFVFCAIIVVVNLGFILSVGRVLRLNLEELLLVSNASIGGPPTAAAMAISAGWTRLVLPGLLAGIWGYVIGTPLGIVVIETLRRWFA